MRRLSASASAASVGVFTLAVAGCNVIVPGRGWHGAFGWRWSVWSILVVLAQAWCIVEIVQRRDLDGTTKLLWCLGVLLFPVLGTLVYWVAGRGECCRHTRYR